MTPIQLISAHITQGNDVVIAEEHGAIAQTFKYFAEVIQSNKSGISAVSLELPFSLQDTINSVYSGRITDKNSFLSHARLGMENSFRDEASILFESGLIDQNTYEEIGNQSAGIVSAINSGAWNEDYPEDKWLRHQEAFGAMYDLILVAKEQNIPVLANDVRHGYNALMSERLYDSNAFGTAELFELFRNRVDDESDFNNLSQQLNLETAEPILIHRGLAHIVGIKGDAKGLDDFLERSGRSVVTIGHMSSVDALNNFNNTYELAEGNGLTTAFNQQRIPITDPVDSMIVDGEVLDPSAPLKTGQNSFSLSPTNSPPPPDHTFAR